MIQRRTIDLRNLFKMSLILMECVAQGLLKWTFL